MKIKHKRRKSTAIMRTGLTLVKINQTRCSVEEGRAVNSQYYNGVTKVGGSLFCGS